MEPLPPLPSLKTIHLVSNFEELKGENFYNNKSNSCPCNLGCDPSPCPISY
jgi:hypothetical protein